MRTTDKKVATPARRPTSVHLTAADRRALERLCKLKYHGLTGITTILREEGMRAVREEITRIEEAKEPTS
jgi:hypothetical protein